MKTEGAAPPPGSKSLRLVLYSQDCTHKRTAHYWLTARQNSTGTRCMFPILSTPCRCPPRMQYMFPHLPPYSLWPRVLKCQHLRTARDTDCFSQLSMKGGMQTPALHVQELNDVLPAGEFDELGQLMHVHVVVLERYFPAMQLHDWAGGGGEGGDEAGGGAGLGGGATTTVQRPRTAASTNKRERLRNIHRSRRVMARTAPPCRAVCSLQLPYARFGTNLGPGVWCLGRYDRSYRLL